MSRPPTPLRPAPPQTIVDFAHDRATAQVGATRAQLQSRRRDLDAQLAAYEVAFDAAIVALTAPGAGVSEAVSVKEAARRIGCSISYIYEQVELGHLKKVPNLGKRVVIPMAEIAAFVAAERSAS